MTVLTRTYMDWNATAPLRPAVRDVLVEALDMSGNPSSVHREGRAARAAVELLAARLPPLLARKRRM